MEVFIRGVPEGSTERGLNEFFEDVMKRLNIEDWTCQKWTKDFANLVFLNESDGIRFHHSHGHIRGMLNSRMKLPGVVPLEFNGALLKCTPNVKPLNNIAVNNLLFEKKKNLGEAKNPKTASKMKTNQDFRGYSCQSICCGIWEQQGVHLQVKTYFCLYDQAKLVFKSRHVSYETNNQERLDFVYNSIQSVARDKQELVFTLREAPRSSRVLEPSFGSSTSTRERVPGLSGDHEKVSGSCLVYRITLEPHSQLEWKLNNLKQIRGLPRFVLKDIAYTISGESYARTFKRLLDGLNPTAASLPFPVRFQLQRLAQNGYLSPETVLCLIPMVQQLFKRSGERVTIKAIQKLFQTLPYAGPDVDPDLFSNDSLINQLQDLEHDIKHSALSEEDLRQPDQIAVIHKGQVTPSGIYLYGPASESTNRVLRKYSGHHDYFLRIQFIEEDGSQLQYNRMTSNKPIFQRFKRIMDEGISIAGQRYAFLGFSHSSLRSQSCWFMAPFVYQGSLLLDRKLIKGLGNFSQIRCPARCAARIGQAFSDTREAITLPIDVAIEIKDVQRNGRVFSDGVGTISQRALSLIWAGLPASKRPTVLQIRYKGAKGMLALDSRLKGTKLCLRESMTKFRGSDSADLEICTAGYKPIPLYLNEQMIPILEKLGVSDNWFYKLQRNEIERLHSTTATAKNAAKFLASHSIGDQIKLPWFIERLSQMKLAFQQDDFLTRVVEAAVLVQLRTLKYKARIPVKHGYTLLGIMDETGILNEGQVFCITDDSGVSRVITGQNGQEVIVTRSPALHPGDVQTAVAVEVPSSSPLMKLQNCIVFSQRGSRDLPSMLSGGDLDGDLYHVIFDHRASITRPTFTPADYPRQPPRELDREVESSDMTDFFVEFMETDQLGRICNTHKMIADQSRQGVTDPYCIMLAEMASTAVDFSKTGIPVDMKQFRKIKFNRIRPHFMAPGPYVEILKHKPISFDSEQTAPDDGPDEDADFQGFKYYPSTRLLGKLFDTVDEHEIFQRLKENTDYAAVNKTGEWNRSTSLLQQVWKHLRYHSPETDYRSQISRARTIHQEYEDSIINLLYEYGPSPNVPLTEIEMFIGSILGKVGAPTARQREMAMSMKERFEDIISTTVRYITEQQVIHDNENDEDQKRMAMLEKGVAVGMACLWVGINDEASAFGDGKAACEGLKSFGYVTAAVTLKSLDRLRRF
ncbi:rna-dependent rna polymeras-like protein [Amylocarpus encephaloides]|uniref:RNA-dependent RNA polymerase n=1 Tax=Amylocarpus encephaloides TaxID=45428 RepID=A0A9P7YIS7_9HELO|nr:rna-dependent rna polymeras-like protein [Amylocarpus encephaloides]